MIRYQTDDEGVVSQPEYTLTKPSNGPNDRDHLTGHDVNRQRQPVREIGGNLKWHEVIGDPTLANAILDRLVHNAYKLDLKGDSMRKRSRPSTRTENRDS